MKNQKVRDSYKSMPCLVCRRTPSDPCHIKSYATTLQDNANNLMPLCRVHHTESHKIGIVTFVKKYPSVELFVRGLGFYINEYGKLSRDLF